MAGRRSDNELTSASTAEVTPPGLPPDPALYKVKELAPHLQDVEKARNKVDSLRVQVVERVRRGLLSSESADALIQNAEMELERAELKFDQARRKVMGGRPGARRIGV